MEPYSTPACISQGMARLPSTITLLSVGREEANKFD